MGQSQSKIGDDDAPSVNDGVRVTQELLQQLSGKPRSRPVRQLERRPSSEFQQSSEEDGNVVMQLDSQLQDALTQSRRVGDLLLKSEQKELAQIDDFATCLLEREYRAPSKGTPCLAERNACLQCYKDNKQNALRCAEAVQAYAECARHAMGSIG